LSLQNKVLCRKVAAKRVEDGADKQSACSEVLARQISQLANEASGDSFRTQVLLVLPAASALQTCCRTTLPVKL